MGVRAEVAEERFRAAESPSQEVSERDRSLRLGGFLLRRSLGLEEGLEEGLVGRGGRVLEEATGGGDGLDLKRAEAESMLKMSCDMLKGAGGGFWEKVARWTWFSWLGTKLPQRVQSEGVQEGGQGAAVLAPVCKQGE